MENCEKKECRIDQLKKLLQELTPYITENSGLTNGFNEIEKFYHQTKQCLSLKNTKLQDIKEQLTNINQKVYSIENQLKENEEKLKGYLGNDFEDLSTVYSMKDDVQVRQLDTQNRVCYDWLFLIE